MPLSVVLEPPHRDNMPLAVVLEPPHRDNMPLSVVLEPSWLSPRPPPGVVRPCLRSTDLVSQLIPITFYIAFHPIVYQFLSSSYNVSQPVAFQV